MTLAQRIKLGLEKVVPGSRISYKAKPEKNQSVLSDAQLRKLKNSRTTPAKGAIKQYGDKGYKPSTGRGVSH